MSAHSPRKEKLALHRSETTDTEPHCLCGELLFKSVSWLKPSARIVRLHHTPWHDLHESIDAPAMLEAQLLLLADTLERAIDRNTYILLQQDALVARIRAMQGRELHPDVVDQFMSLSTREEFWLDIVSPRLYSILLRQGPYRKLEVDLDELAALALLFRNIIDFRSRFTATHSSGVSICASAIAEIFGLAAQDVMLMAVAGNVHDLGKLIISNTILEKPDRLTVDEFALIRQHTYWTYAILNSIGGLGQVAEWAAFHHEKMNGAGYPFHLGTDRLSSGARIMAVADVFTALTEDRPYRAGMGKDAVIRILRTLVGEQHLDGTIVDLAADNYDHLQTQIQEQQHHAREFYETQYLGCRCACVG